MLKYTLKVDGMACGMCEAHVNDAVRKVCPNVKKVTSSHAMGETVILTEQELDEEKLRKDIGETGYELKSVSKEPYEKKGLFGFLHK